MSKENVAAVSALFEKANVDAPAVETPEPEAPPVEEPEVEAPVQAAEEAEEPGGEAEVEGDAEIHTIAQLAEAIEVDAAYLYDIEVGMGEGHEPVKLGQLKDEYQAVLREREELKGKAEEAQKYAEQAYNFQSGLQGASQEMLAALSEADAIQKQYAAEDWEKLEQSDAGRAALLRQKYSEAYQTATGKVQEAQQKEQQGKQQQLQLAAGRMLEIIPEWKDKGARKVDQDKIRTMLHGEGMTDTYINSIADPVAMKLLRELMQLRAEKGAATEAIQKGRKKPKPLRGRGRTPPPDQNKLAKELTEKARNTTLKSGRRQAEVEAAKAILGAGVR